MSYLQPLFHACINFSYHPTAFCYCNTIPLRKPGKGDYSAPGAWRPIALLNTLSRVLESIRARQISSLSEEHGLLPAQHMGARRSRFINMALDFLVQQIQTIWQNNDGVATLLSLDMMGNFDSVVPARLLHNIRERKIPESIVKWVSSFIRNRTTTLCLPGYNNDNFLTHTGIPQCSPLSSIIFLVYNADLVDAYNLPTLPTSENRFMNIVNALAFGKTTEDNCEHCKVSMSAAWSGQGNIGHCLPQRSILLCTLPKQGQSITPPAPSPPHHSQSAPAHLLTFWGSFLTRNSAGSHTCNTSSRSWLHRPMNSKGL